MNKQLAIIAAVAALAAFGEEQVKTYAAPDGVNTITERTDENGVKTYSSTCAHVQETVDEGLAAFDSAVIKAQETLKGGGNGGGNSKPFLVKKVRSPLGKEIDATRFAIGVQLKNAYNVIRKQNEVLTNLAARVASLEGAEAERKRRIDEARERAAKRKSAREEKRDNGQTLREAIRRGKKLEAKMTPEQKKEAAKKAADIIHAAREVIEGIQFNPNDEYHQPKKEVK